MFVGRETQVVDVGPRITKEDFARILTERGSPAASEAGDAWEIVTAQAVDPLFALAIFHQESQFANDPISATAQFGLRNPGHARTSRIGFTDTVNTPHGPFMRYPSWQDGWRDLAFRLVDPTFVYRQEGRATIDPIIHRWAPPEQNDTPNYINRAVAFMNEFASAGVLEVPDNEEDAVNLVFGNVPHPEHTRDIITKQEGLGMNNLGPRSNFGVVYHRTLGRSIRGTGEFFKDPSTMALTQYGVGAPPPCEAGEDGDIFMWADPIGNVAPWASGPANGLEGDGVAFHAKFGPNAINRDLIAIEISGLMDDPISDTTMNAVAAISAFWADQARIPHHTYPLNPHTGLLYTYWHREFATKDCPFSVVMSATSEIVGRTKAMMKTHQTGTM